MEIKKLLNEEFKQEESRIKNDKSKVGDQSFLSTDKFLSNFDKYHKKLLTKKDEYKEKVTKTNDKYKTRLSKQAIFDQAKALYDQGNFYEAYYIFETILGFGSTNEYYEICKKELDALYQKAQDLVKNYQYQEAIDILNSIINYRDAKRLVEDYKKGFEVDKNYLRGIELFNAQNYMDAYKMFVTLGDYRDSKDYFSKCDNELLKIYLGANELKDKHKYDEATQMFNSIIDYKDSRKIIKEIVGLKDRYLDLDQQYQEAVDLFNKGRWMEAYLMFCFIEDHRDSKDYIAKCEKELDALYQQAFDLINEYRYQEAINIFRTIEEYEDSLDHIKECEELIELDRDYYEGIDLYNNHKYMEAFKVFKKLKHEFLGPHRELDDYYDKCQKDLDNIYNQAVTNFNNEQLDESLRLFESINGYKDSSKYIDKIKKKQQDNAIATAKRKKRIKIFSILGAVSAVVVAALVLTFVVFIPQAKLKQNKDNYAAGVALINEGKYLEASQKLNGVDYENATDLYHIALAGVAFEDNDYNSGIENMCLAKGKTNVTYDGDGGNATKTSETITTYTPISAKSVKDYNDFVDWDVTNFDIEINETNYTCALALKATYKLTDYKITYVLNGGTNNKSNPDTYTYESNNINLSNPTKTGYTFMGWTKDDSPITNIPKHSSGNVTLVANWSVNQYKLTLDYGEGIPSGDTEFLLDYDSSIPVNDPIRKGGAFIGWFDSSDKQISSTWTMPDKEVTLKAKYKLHSEGKFVYDDIYNHNSDYMPGDGWYISGINFYSYDELVVPSMIDGKRVIAISSDAFKDCGSYIKYLEIQPGLDYIAPGALSSFAIIEELVTPFIGASKEWNWRYPSGANYVLGAMFYTTDHTNTDQYYCYYHGYSDSKPKRNNLTETSTNSNMYELISFYIPNTLKTVRVNDNLDIYCGAFSNCSNLENIILRSGTSSYGYSFYNCPATITYQD